MKPPLLPSNLNWLNSGGWFSTETSLIHTTDVFLKGIDDKKLNACVLLDLSKAFDSVDQQILLRKIQSGGVLTRGPFLEGPGNVSGPKSNFQIEI